MTESSGWRLGVTEQARQDAVLERLATAAEVWSRGTKPAYARA
jgi:hypothetical protein